MIDFNRRICELLKVDPAQTASITIVFRPNELPQVELRQFVVSEAGERQLDTFLRQFELVERTPGDPPTRTPGPFEHP
jgi:hypothetical protein